MKGKGKLDQLKKLKHDIQKQQRTSYWNYIENMICGIPVDENPTTISKSFPKNLFSYIKTQKSESSNIPPLRKEGSLTSDSIAKANILNEQFKKAFTPVTDDPIPDKGVSKHPQMPDIKIQQQGIEKLLNNININKACCS